MNVLQNPHVSVLFLHKIRVRFCSVLLWCKSRVTAVTLILPGSHQSACDLNAALDLT